MQQRVILWSAILASVVVMGIVARFVAPASAGPLDPTIPIALGASAVIDVLISLFLPPVLARTAVQRLGLKTTEAPSFGDLPAGTKVFVDSDAARVAGLGATMAAFLVRIMLREAVAILGVVLAAYGYPASLYLRFLLMGFLLVALAYPRIAEVEVALESAYGAKLTHAR